MRGLSIFWVLLLLPMALLAQTGFNCQAPIAINSANSCSQAGQYDNTNSVQNGLTWFKFTAKFPVITITVSGAGTGGTLVKPTIDLYADCAGSKLAAINSTTANITTLHAEDLTVGQSYYIAVGGQNKGSFEFCLNNYNPPPDIGEDCETAIYLDDSNFDIHVKSLTGPGNKPHESVGSCLAGDESNTTWYKWKAGNNGTLVFTLTPDEHDNDIDFVLYDLDTTGDCSGVTASNAIRCAAGHGVEKLCANENIYYKTGLAFDATDESEAGGCGSGQDGVVKYVDMIKGHNYGLLVNNYTGNTGFTISFTDQNGKAGTGTFDAPDAVINYVSPACAADRTYIFNNYLTARNQFTWDFGTGATIKSADASGNFTVVYDKPGKRTITLTVKSPSGKQSINQSVIDVPATQTPDKPVIKADKSIYCVGDMIKLSTPPLPGLTYQWSGPGNFTSTDPAISIPVTAGYVSGEYTLVARNGGCSSALGNYTPILGITPKAAFTTSPKTGTTIYIPAMVELINESVNADSYLWDFGDGTTSTDPNPLHTYTKGGVYHVKLTATNNTSCSASVTEGDFIIKYGNVIFIPNSFTPNNDGINDKFGVSITNLGRYHIQVFNRQGSVVFDSRDALATWDGTYKGSPLPVGTYYYIIDAIGLDGNVIKQAGNVTVLR